MLIVFLYVDDMIFAGDFGIKEFKSVMKDKFEMTDLGLMRYFLGIEIHQSKVSIFQHDKFHDKFQSSPNTCHILIEVKQGR
jgi:hypothetical protein